MNSIKFSNQQSTWIYSCLAIKQFRYSSTLPSYLLFFLHFLLLSVFDTDIQYCCCPGLSTWLFDIQLTTDSRTSVPCPWLCSGSAPVLLRLCTDSALGVFYVPPTSRNVPASYCVLSSAIHQTSATLNSLDNININSHNTFETY